MWVAASLSLFFVSCCLGFLLRLCSRSPVSWIPSGYVCCLGALLVVHSFAFCLCLQLYPVGAPDTPTHRTHRSLLYMLNHIHVGPGFFIFVLSLLLSRIPASFLLVSF
eukprot:GHVQ01010605.1.p2 GENE.GHVQ01010605.1~~GHVQ01010605.1.p2  ORF type:complete len:108 (+),score=4.70 GHVQ01010605.1:130-453(+)